MEKKIFLISGFVVIISILLVLIYGEIRPSSSDPATTPEQVNENPFDRIPPSKKNIVKESPLSTTESCFIWYLEGSLNGANILDTLKKPELQDCFSQDFIDRFREIIQNTGSDPILLVQEIGETWDAPPLTKIIQENEKGSLVEIMIGEGEEQKIYTVTLVKSDEKGWLISEISSPI